jgi:hypothetical protein
MAGDDVDVAPSEDSFDAPLFIVSNGLLANEADA